MSQPTKDENMCVAATYAFDSVSQRLSRSIMHALLAAEPLRHEFSYVRVATVSA